MSKSLRSVFLLLGVMSFLVSLLEELVYALLVVARKSRSTVDFREEPQFREDDESAAKAEAHNGGRNVQR